MKKLIYLLSGLLAAQLLLTLLLNSGSSVSSHSVNQALLALDANKIDSIILSDANGASVKLTRDKQQWQLPEHDNFAADQHQVGQLLNTLATLKHGEALADSDSAAERFKVAPNSFARKVTLQEKGTDIVTLYIGTSAAMRKTHVRVAGDEAIYLANLPVYQLPADYSDWVKHDALQLKANEIESVSFDGVTLSRSHNHKTPASDTDLSSNMVAALADGKQPQKHTDTGWQLVPLKTGEQLKVSGLDNVLHQLTNLRVSKLLGSDSQGDYNLDAPVLEVTVKRNQGKEVRYTLAPLSHAASSTQQATNDANNSPKGFVLKSSLSPEYFLLPTEQAKPFIEAFQADQLSHAVVANNATTSKASNAHSPG
ncbi:hypothetical protein HR45_18360 [Shewanella mangrovi]|uniref:DUF4340 domain-containing protein n=1 Tax=Shewanella mangrovi TaxID=1515746 RepID=A0A094LLM9_9GAMM|nr:DUF4340 domain-containing protein [Shewanella mangrovi]KFZ36043.1 hypothetical protein HR45_18360 [Shewanella mangrovi]